MRVFYNKISKLLETHRLTIAPPLNESKDDSPEDQPYLSSFLKYQFYLPLLHLFLAIPCSKEKNSQPQLVATQFKHPRLIYPLPEYPLPIINFPLPRREPRINQS